MTENCSVQTLHRHRTHSYAMFYLPVWSGMNVATSCGRWCFSCKSSTHMVSCTKNWAYPSWKKLQETTHVHPFCLKGWFMMSKTREDQVRFKSKLPLFNTVPCVTDCWTVDETCVKISAPRSRVSCFRFFPCSTLPLGPSMQRNTMWIHNFQTSSQPLGDMLRVIPKPTELHQTKGQEKGGPSDRGQLRVPFE